MQSMSSMEDAVKQIQDQVGPGMIVVNQEDGGEGVFAEFNTELEACDALCEVADPVETPYKSKYEARDRLNHLCNKLEANKTVASLEKKKSVIKNLEWRIAALQVRLGSIAWDVEEPHSCQMELDHAVEFYFPGVKSKIEELAGDEIVVEGDATPPASDFADLSPPPIHLPEAALCASGLKCLNMLGILWAGRGHSRRSFLYLLASKSLYDQTSELVNLTPKDAAEIESTFTHNLFYLAQAYGNHGDATKSSYYCHMTLQRQLNAGLADQNAALDWCKNCMGIADFYMALGKFKKCGTALAATEVVLLHFFHLFPEDPSAAADSPPPTPAVTTAEALVSAVSSAVAAPPPPPPASVAPSKPLHAVPLLPTLLEPKSEDLKSRLQEVEADYNRRWARLDGTILKLAYEWQSEMAMLAEDGNVVEPPRPAEDPVDDTSTFQKLPFPMRELPVLDPARVRTFEEAREVFLRAAGRIEVAKREFPMDGFVTDHSNLLEEHSRLFHHLSIFEKDLKRRTAMQNKRLDLLKPIVFSLNRNAYDALHKQVSYELGEVYISLADLLSEKYASGSAMKKADVVKSNEYCLGGISMFAHFTSMYEMRTGKGPVSENYIAVGYDGIANAGCLDPDESLLNSDELRPFLNAHFHMARLMTKISVPQELPTAQKSQYLVVALKRYEWLVKAVPKYCTLKDTPIEDVFKVEFDLCKEMVELLPTRINRVHYLGASS